MTESPESPILCLDEQLRICGEYVMECELPNLGVRLTSLHFRGDRAMGMYANGVDMIDSHLKLFRWETELTKTPLDDERIDKAIWLEWANSDSRPLWIIVVSAERLPQP